MTKSHAFPSSNGNLTAENEDKAGKSSRCLRDPGQQSDATGMFLCRVTALPVRVIHPSLSCDCNTGLLQGRGWSFIPGTTKLFCLPRTTPDHHTRNNKVCFLVLFATVRHPVGTLRALGLAIQGRAGHPGWMLQFSVASPAEVLSSPEWTWAGVGNAACASPGRQAGT